MISTYPDMRLGDFTGEGLNIHDCSIDGAVCTTVYNCTLCFRLKSNLNLKSVLL